MIRVPDIRYALRAAIAACAVAALAGLFLPWARWDIIRETALEKQISEKVRKTASRSFKPRKKPLSWPTNSKTVLLPTRVSGAQIPVLANSRNAKVALALAKRFGHAQGPIGTQSYAVYLLPGLVVLAAILLAACESRWIVGAAVAGLCALVAIAGIGWLAFNDTRALYSVTVGAGIWVSLAAYAGLALLAGAQCWRCQSAPWRDRARRRAK